MEIPVEIETNTAGSCYGGALTIPKNETLTTYLSTVLQKVLNERDVISFRSDRTTRLEGANSFEASIDETKGSSLCAVNFAC